MAIYLRFFGLERDPFGTTPDPDFLYLTHGHREALAQLTLLQLVDFTEQGEGLYARALQHEFDHIEGVTIIKRMPEVARIAHRKQLKKLEEANGDAGS